MKINLSLLSVSLLILFASTDAIHAQFGFEYDDSILVKVGANTIDNPWGGGLNYAQFSDFDYDFDGDMDLFVFDRSKNNIRVFTQESNGGLHYELAYNAKNKFPENIRYRATMVDYDNDGKKDLFTQGIGGLKVYRNVGSLATGIQWELVNDLIYSQYPTNFSNLIINSSDVPAIVDVDGDSDIDILTFHQGGTTLEYHQNQSMELYGIPDSLTFVLKNQCWGKFSENITTNSILLNDTSYPCQGGDIANPELVEDTLEKITRHAGSTVLAFDYNNSGVLDLVIGDVSFTNLNLLINGGTAVNTDSPIISVDNSFPSNTTPTNIQLFPAAYLVDVDFDLIKDLIVCPNAKNISINERSVHFYKNIGTNTNPTFIFTSDNFLQNQMIEHGTGSIPTFTDVNQDGLQDMLIANFYRYKPTLDKESTLAYYQNTGTSSSPIFTYIDYDYLNLSTENYGLRSVPTFGDIDGDNDDDIILGTEAGTLIYYENTGVGSGAVYANATTNIQDNTGTSINVLSYAHPQLFDLNNDGLLDLIVGNKAGKLFYYENIGTLTAPSFQLKNTLLGNIDIAPTLPDGYAAPHFFRLNGETHLFIGGVYGKLNYYTNIDGNLAPGQDFDLVSNSYLNIDVESYSSFYINDINQDGNLNLFVGQDLGGIFHFEANPNSNASIAEVEQDRLVTLYPNPTSDKLTLFFNTVKGTEYVLRNMHGQIVQQSTIKTRKTQVNINTLTKGVFVIQITLENGHVITKKIVKH
ncbi:MAG: T9SS type A sorting domain-containing protein [Crocinitomicaceae bacterium]|nr:T9SS type A sorting domain-containing protein [Crocinitomicaceae bacterium]MDG1775931.1 T9SS type A sorting domain-containing protein [Crocinitomicaceae bacterium]